MFAFPFRGSAAWPGLVSDLGASQLTLAITDIRRILFSERPDIVAELHKELSPAPGLGARETVKPVGVGDTLRTRVDHPRIGTEPSAWG